MANDNDNTGMENLFSRNFKAGKRRKYYFDVKSTRANDFFVIITESRKRFSDTGYDRHRIFLYKEDFNRFLESLMATVNYIKTELNPDYDYDYVDHGYIEEFDDFLDESSDNSEVADHNIDNLPQSEVIIYIPDKEVSILNAEEITNNCGDFMEGLGYQLETEDKPIFSSFWKRIKFVFAKHVSPEEIDQLFNKGKRALELKHVELPSAEQTEKLANAAEKIVASLDKFEEGVVRLGTLLVLKKKVNGESKILIQQLNQDLVKILDQKPQLLKSLQTLYELVTGDIEADKEKDDTNSLPATIEFPE